MSDPQTAADAAERNDVAAARVEAWLDGYNPILPKAAVRTLLWERAELLADHKRLAAELEQVRGERAAIPADRYPGAWAELTGWLEEAVDDGGPVDAAELLAYMAELQRKEREEAREWMRSLFGEAAETTATRPADGTAGTGDLRTPEQWCAEYGIDIRDPDGWRNTGDPAWDEPITLPDFFRRAVRSTCWRVTTDVWN